MNRERILESLDRLRIVSSLASYGSFVNLTTRIAYDHINVFYVFDVVYKDDKFRAEVDCSGRIHWLAEGLTHRVVDEWLLKRFDTYVTHTNNFYRDLKDSLEEKNDE